MKESSKTSGHEQTQGKPTIIVTLIERIDQTYAALVTDPLEASLSGIGKTEAEALGLLIKRNPDIFSIRLVKYPTTPSAEEIPL